MNINLPKHQNGHARTIYTAVPSSFNYSYLADSSFQLTCNLPDTPEMRLVQWSRWVVVILLLMGWWAGPAAVASWKNYLQQRSANTTSYLPTTPPQFLRHLKLIPRSSQEDVERVAHVSTYLPPERLLSQRVCSSISTSPRTSSLIVGGSASGGPLLGARWASGRFHIWCHRSAW